LHAFVSQAQTHISTIGCIRCTRPSRRNTSVSRRSARDRKRRPIVFPDRSGDAKGTGTAGDGTSADMRHLRRRKGCPRSALVSPLTAWSTRDSSPTITTGRDMVSRGIADLWILMMIRRDTSPNEVILAIIILYLY